MASAYDLVHETIGQEVHDEEGTCYRVDDVRATLMRGGYYEYHFGLRELGSLTRKALIYVNMDRFDEMG